MNYRISSVLFIMATLVVGGGLAPVLLGDFPRNQYYIAGDFLEDGQTVEAAQGFDMELRSTNSPLAAAGIESIPSLVMLGECNYMQGDLASAMERYDAALEAGIRAAGWTSRLQPGIGPVERTDSVLTGIQWWKRFRETRPSAHTTRWQLNVAGQNGVIQLAPSDVSTTSPYVSVDALEILRVQAIALRRRALILGPLVKHSPRSAPLAQIFRFKKDMSDPSIIASMNICHALALIGSGDANAAEGLLKANLSLPNGMDHPLTPIALLTLADLALEIRDWKNATQWLADASASAAEFEQFDIAAESICLLGSLGSVRKDSWLIPFLNAVTNWSKNKSRLLALAASGSQAQIQAVAGDSTGLASSLKFCETAMQPKEVVLPRYESNLDYARAQHALSKGDTPNGLKSLDRSLALIRGNRQLGSSCKALFQLQMIESLTNAKKIEPAVAMGLLERCLVEPGEREWLLDPGECLVWLTSDKRSVFQLALDLRTRERNAEKISECLDNYQRNLFWSSEAAGGRLISLRLLLHDDRLVADPILAKAAERLKQQHPAILQLAKQIQFQQDNLKQRPIEVDSKKWSEETRKLWQSFQQLCERQENQIWQLAIARQPHSLSFPPPLRPESMRKAIGSRDGLISFYLSEGKWYGLWINAKGTQVWEVKESPMLEPELTILMKSLGVGQLIPHTTDAWKEKQWKRNAAKLAQMLIPDDVRALMADTDRLMVVPTGPLWYLPFEILPLTSDTNAKPGISKRRMAYFPTLGTCTWSALPASKPNKTLAITKPGFFAVDDKRDQQMIADIVTAIPKTMETSLQLSGTKFQNGRWGRMQADRLVVASPLISRNIATLAPMAIDQNNPDGFLTNWLLLPLASPQQIILPGFESLVSSGKLGDGADLFELSCVMLASNSRSLLVSRWPVRGASSSQFIMEYLQGLESDSPSMASRRAILASWANQFESEYEPSLGNHSRGDTLQSGEEPFFWAGYMQIGDTP